MDDFDFEDEDVQPDNDVQEILGDLIFSDETIEVEPHEHDETRLIVPESENFCTPTKSVINGGDNYKTFVSPGGTKYWVPIVDESVRLGMSYEFPSIEAADVAYRKYAEQAGFDVRQSNKKRNPDGDIQNRYLLCSRQGVPTKREYDSINFSLGDRKRRNSNVKRSDCKACIKFRFRKEDRCYVVYKFEERHNHCLYNNVDKSLARSRRQMQYVDYRNVYNASSSCIGGAKSHMIQAALKGGYEYLGATSVDYQNARRDMGTFVGKKDAQMLVDLLSKRKSVVPDYFFDYLVEEGELQAVFWADEIARLNYKEFGDNISFDATYRTNRHAMNFVPFIAIDNHKRSVVVGAALISHENIDNFKWILSAFLKAHGSQLRFVITDQCAAMRQAIPFVFTESKHRLCMWHIMKKLPGKTTPDLDANVTFNKRFNKLVWSTHMKPEEFELEWASIIEDYGLHGNNWLKDMFEIRESWIPSYYRDDPMSGLMRTSSRSESAHAFFRLFASYSNDLVKFIHAFDGAMERQRNKHRTLEFVTRNTFPRCFTPLLIERHASEVYTRTVFFEVRKEIRKAAFYCGSKMIGEDGDVKRYRVSHKNSKSVTKYTYIVVHDTEKNTMTCECNLYLRTGYLCRHMFKVLLNDDYNSIPKEFIARRWTRSLVPVEIQAARARYGEVDVDKERLINGLYAKYDLLISRLRNDKVKLNSLGEKIDKITIDFDVENVTSYPAVDRAEALRESYGVDVPDHVQIHPPTGIRNKGCGTGKRLVGALEKATAKGKRPKRKCKLCNSMANHDSRNCPLRGASG